MSGSASVDAGGEVDCLEAVAIVTASPERWVETMLREEHGLAGAPRSATRAAAVMFGAFVTVGFQSLLAFVLDVALPGGVPNAFLWSSLLTGAAFFLVGAAKSRVLAGSWYVAGAQTLILGGTAAAVAFGVRVILRDLAN